jgi:hypothetical protein
MDPRPGLGQAGDAVGGIQPAGEGQGDSLHIRYLCNRIGSRNPAPEPGDLPSSPGTKCAVAPPEPFTYA